MEVVEAAVTVNGTLTFIDGRGEVIGEFEGGRESVLAATK